MQTQGGRINPRKLYCNSQANPKCDSPGPEEVMDFHGCVTNAKQRTILTTCYAAGLPISEAIHLMPNAIDRQRMVIRGEQGKGARTNM
jgi:hypothetical protein